MNLSDTRRGRLLLALVVLAFGTAYVEYAHFFVPVAHPRRDPPAAGLSPFRALSGLELGRLLLLSRQPERARLVFEELWERPADLGRHCIAFYSALAAEAMRDPRASSVWYARAFETAPTDSLGRDQAAFCLIAGQCEPRGILVAMNTVSLDLLSTAQVPGADRHENSRLARDKLAAALKSYEADRSIQNRVRVLSWRLLHAELASDDRLYTRANKEFIEA